MARIAGRLYDSQNNPVPDVLVEIEGVPPTRQPNPIFRPLTDSHGYFHYDNLEMGEYILGVNLASPPDAHDWYGKRLPFPRSYYPGVTDRRQAAIVRLQNSKNIDDLEFHLPPVPNPMIIQGRAELPDGSPVQAFVSLLDLEYPGDTAQVDTVLADVNGSFSLQGLAGRKYGILAQTEQDGIVRHSAVVYATGDPATDIRLILSQSERSETCEVCARYKIWQSPLWQPQR